ncbi:MAG: hypothetical protein QXU60_07215 [Sulfolobales archaeon]|uniref:hypothetical protein n=1 Tax=Thermofilum sp. TaxID=1961369 RepID=UPI0031664C4A
MEANKTKIQTIKTQINLVVNTWITRNINWLVKVYDPEKSSLDEMPVYTDIEKLKTLKEMVANLPAIVILPKHFSKLSLPRYYLIFYDEKIIDIIGIRRDKSPTRWSYKTGFWHPAAQISIASSLQKLLKELGQ